jgi:hypothetical protein
MRRNIAPLRMTGKRAGQRMAAKSDFDFWHMILGSIRFAPPRPQVPESHTPADNQCISKSETKKV